MIIVGILLLVCAAIAVLLQDLLAFWLCALLALYCLNQGMKKKPPKHIADISKTAEPTPAPSPIKPETAIPTQEQKPLGKCVKSLTFKVSGVTLSVNMGHLIHVKRLWKFQRIPTHSFSSRIPIKDSQLFILSTRV